MGFLGHAPGAFSCWVSKDEKWVFSLGSLADDGFGLLIPVPSSPYAFLVGDWLWRDR
jgi:hypothetical protein